MKLSLIAILLVFFAFRESRAQEMRYIEGTIRQADSKTPVAHANVYLKSNPRIGTISNANGRFELYLKYLPNDTLVVSFIGFEPVNVPLRQLFGNRTTIELREAENLLTEVTVFDRDTLPDFLRRVFDKIETNYGTHAKLIKGLYRETNQLLPGTQFLYFSESVIEFYKPGYHNRQMGPCRILSGDKIESTDSSRESSELFFYAGVYAPQRFDFVKERYEFINPGHFKKYSYKIESTTIFGGHEIVKIKFEPRRSARFEGVFYINKTDLAYEAGDFSLSPHGLQLENSITANNFDFTKRRYFVKYQSDNGIREIFMVIQDGVGIINRTKTQIRYTNEYVTTDADTVSVNPIKDQDALPMHGIYSLQHSRFDHTYWDTRSPAGQQLTLHDSTFAVPTSAFFETQKVNRRGTGKKRFHAFISRFSTGFSMLAMPISVQAGVYTIRYTSHVNAREPIGSDASLLAWSMDLKYRFKPAWAISFGSCYGAQQSYMLNITSVGMEWRKRLSGWRYPWLLQSGIHVQRGSFQRIVASFDVPYAFAFGEKKIGPSRVSAGIGETSWSLRPFVQLEKKISIRCSLFFDVSLLAASASRENFFLQETSGFFLARKSAHVALHDTTIEVLKDGQPLAGSTPSLRLYTPIFAIGFHIGF